MGKTLLTILLVGASLVFGANQLKGQEKPEDETHTRHDYINEDQDEFLEKVSGAAWHGQDENNQYIADKKGLSIIYYHDKDNNNSHEFIRILNEDKDKRLVIEDFNIDREAGLIDYHFKQYSMSADKWNKYFVGKSVLKMVNLEFDDLLVKEKKEYYPNLSLQEIGNLYPGFRGRVQRLLNASEDKDKFKDKLIEMAKRERLFWKIDYENKEN